MGGRAHPREDLSLGVATPTERVSHRQAGVPRGAQSCPPVLWLWGPRSACRLCPAATHGSPPAAASGCPCPGPGQRSSGLGGGPLLWPWTPWPPVGVHLVEHGRCAGQHIGPRGSGGEPRAAVCSFTSFLWALALVPAVPRGWGGPGHLLLLRGGISQKGDSVCRSVVSDLPSLTRTLLAAASCPLWGLPLPGSQQGCPLPADGRGPRHQVVGLPDAGLPRLPGGCRRLGHGRRARTTPTSLCLLRPGSPESLFLTPRSGGSGGPQPGLRATSARLKHVPALEGPWCPCCASAAPVRDSRCPQVYIGHSEPVRAVAFAPDQQRLLSVGDAIFLWDILGPLERSPPGRQVPALGLLPSAFCCTLPT